MKITQPTMVTIMNLVSKIHKKLDWIAKSLVSLILVVIFGHLIKEGSAILNTREKM